MEIASLDHFARWLRRAMLVNKSSPIRQVQAIQAGEAMVNWYPALAFSPQCLCCAGAHRSKIFRLGTFISVAAFGC
jgi:hypothetical protein